MNIDDEARRFTADAMAAIRERNAAGRCERVLPDGEQCPRRAAQDVDGDRLCHEHAAED